MRLLLVLTGLFLVTASPLLGQSQLPDAARLDKLNLRADWTVSVPLQGAKDAVEIVQAVDTHQVFVQTRSGLLVAYDARTGAKQWGVAHPTRYANIYPVAVDDRLVYCVNITDLIAYQRYTGVIEFRQELPAAATSGPVADKDLVYVVTNSTDLIAYRAPDTAPANVLDKKGKAAVDGVAKTIDKPSPVFTPYTLDRSPNEIREIRDFGYSGYGPISQHATPSFSSLPSVTPPYTLRNRAMYSTPSLTTVTSLRQPYTSKPTQSGYASATPSTTAVPTLVRLAELSDLRTKPVGPTRIWTYRSVDRIVNTPLLLDHESPLGRREPSRIWLTTEGRKLIAVSRAQGKELVNGGYHERLSSPLGGPLLHDKNEVSGYVGLLDGTIVAVDMLNGDRNRARAEWKTVVGGFMNRQPIAVTNSVFVGGEHSGIARLDPVGGEILWRSQRDIDRLVAVNDEFVYAQDRFGTLYLYDRNKVVKEDHRRTDPLAKLELPGFLTTVQNDRTNRILLASQDGILLSLRDASKKYALPGRIAADYVPPKLQGVEVIASPDAPAKESPEAPQGGDAPR